VQLVRFGTKLGLARLMAPEDFGQAVLAGSLAFAAGHVALLGLDEAWVHTRRPGPRLLANLSRAHRSSGLTLGLLTALAGLALLTLSDPEQRELGAMLLALAPMVPLANLTVLPTARLVRERDFERLFKLDVSAVLALSLTMLVAAAAGLGGWSLVIGWHANALVTWALVRRAVRAHPLPELSADQEDDPTKTRRFGRHLLGAQISGVLGDGLGGWAVGFGIGRGPMGFYSQGRDLASQLVGWAGQLAERALFPALSAQHRKQALLPSYASALRVGLAWLLPAHLALCLLATPLVILLLPPTWHDTGPVLAVMALAAGARCLDVIACTALKAGDRSRSVAALGVVRVLLLLTTLPLALLRGDLLSVALAVLAAQVLTGALSLWRTRSQLGSTQDRGLVAAARASLALALVGSPVAIKLVAQFHETPWLALLVGAGSLLAIWILARLLLDRAGLLSDLHAIMSRSSRAAESTA